MKREKEGDRARIVQPATELTFHLLIRGGGAAAAPFAQLDGRRKTRLRFDWQDGRGEEEREEGRREGSRKGI